MNESNCVLSADEQAIVVSFAQFVAAKTAVFTGKNCITARALVADAVKSVNKTYGDWLDGACRSHRFKDFLSGKDQGVNPDNVAALLEIISQLMATLSALKGQAEIDLINEAIERGQDTNPSITASATQIQPGDQVIVTWTTSTAATRVDLNGQSVDTCGQKEVYPVKDTTFSIIAYDRHGVASTANVRVEVVDSVS